MKKLNVIPDAKGLVFWIMVFCATFVQSSPFLFGMICINLILAWSSKGDDVIDNFYANGESTTSESQIINKEPSEANASEQEQSSVNGSRGMLQKLRKNIVTPVNVDPKDSDSEVTRINVMGKRSGN